MKVGDYVEVVDNGGAVEVGKVGIIASRADWKEERRQVLVVIFPMDEDPLDEWLATSKHLKLLCRLKEEE